MTSPLLLDAATSVVVLIDPQQKLMPAIHDGDAVVAQCLRLAQAAALLDVPVIGTEQTPDKLGENVAALKALCATTVVKRHFDASAEGLRGALPPQRPQVVLAGCEAHVCVLQTALGLVAHGCEVWVVRDAAGSRRTSDRDAAFERLARHGARLITTEMALFEWMRDSEHPRFRDVLRLIK